MKLRHRGLLLALGVWVLAEPSAGGVIVTLHNRGTVFLTFGADYGVYQRVNGGCCHRNFHWAWLAMGYGLRAGESTSWNVSLPAGTYRVTKTADHTDGPRGAAENPAPCLLAVEFTVP